MKKDLDDDFDLKEVTPNVDFSDGLESSKIFDFVDLGKPGYDDWFKLYNFENKGLSGFIKALIAKKKDAMGIMQPYLILGNDTFKAKIIKRIRPVQLVRIAYGITTNERLFIWPLPIVEDLNAALTWHATGWEIATAALTRWTGIQSNKADSRYIHLDLDKQGEVPKKDSFITPPIPYIDALKKAFKGRIVKNEDHPIYANAGSVIGSKVLSKEEKIKAS